MPYKIISGQYELETPEQQAGYKMLFGENNIQYKFDLYFHWYNILHELGHCVVDVQNIKMTKVQEEMFANEFAVAYWNYVGQEMKIRELENILNEVITNMLSPVPNDMSFVEYYESIWEMEALNNVMVYGYFQMNSVLEAIKNKKDFRMVLQSVNIEMNNDITVDTCDVTVCARNAYIVLENAVANINRLEITLIQVSIELVDNPMIQSARTCE